MATYKGGCHCGKVRFTFEGQIDSAMACNCSMCSKTGTLLAFVPAAQFTLESGDDNLIDYQFNRHVIHHVFCATCGIRSFARGVAPDGTAMAAINTRCVDDLDVSKLTIHHFDGKSA